MENGVPTVKVQERTLRAASRYSYVQSNYRNGLDSCEPRRFLLP